VSATEQDRGTDFGQTVHSIGNFSILHINSEGIDALEGFSRDEAADVPELVFDPSFGATSPLFSAAVTIGTERVDRDDAFRHLIAAVQSRWEQAEEAAEALEVEAAHLSAVRHASASRHFQRLKESGNTGISVALARLMEDWRPLWLYFLQSSTGERPAQGTTSVDEATNAWRSWGRRKGLI
jgi:hypothetical protein